MEFIKYLAYIKSDFFFLTLLAPTGFERKMVALTFVKTCWSVGVENSFTIYLLMGSFCGLIALISQKDVPDVTQSPQSVRMYILICL